MPASSGSKRQRSAPRLKPGVNCGSSYDASYLWLADHLCVPPISQQHLLAMAPDKRPSGPGWQLTLWTPGTAIARQRGHYVMRESTMKIKPTKTRQRLAAPSSKRGAHGPRTIDTSDIPPLSADFFARAIRNPYYRPVKQSTTVRVDADVLAWLRSKGAGYQTRLNAILRSAMLSDR